MDQPITDLQYFHIKGEYMRACVYIRVTSKSPLAFKKTEDIRNYYLRLFKEQNNWTIVDLFEDEGNSGYCFDTMITKARQGEYDIIITPTFSNFGKNSADTAFIIKELKDLSFPVGIYFEIEDVYTLDDNAETAINMLMVLKEYEREQKSRIIRWSTMIKR